MVKRAGCLLQHLLVPQLPLLMAFAHRVSWAACTALGRCFPGTPGMPPWSGDTHQGMSQPAQVTTTHPGAAPFLGVTSSDPFPSPSAAGGHAQAGQSWGRSTCTAQRPAASLAQGETVAMPWGCRVTAPWSLSLHGSHSPAPPVPVSEAWHDPALPVTGRTAPDGSTSRLGLKSLSSLHGVAGADKGLDNPKHCVCRRSMTHWWFHCWGGNAALGQPGFGGIWLEFGGSLRACRQEGAGAALLPGQPAFLFGVI